MTCPLGSLVTRDRGRREDLLGVPQHVPLRAGSRATASWTGALAVSRLRARGHGVMQVQVRMIQVAGAEEFERS